MVQRHFKTQNRYAVCGDVWVSTVKKYCKLFVDRKVNFVQARLGETTDSMLYTTIDNKQTNFET